MGSVVQIGIELVSGFSGVVFISNEISGDIST